MNKSTIAVCLSLGESFTSLKKTGQDTLMVEQNILPLSKEFSKVYVVTYKQESYDLPANCFLIIPPLSLHRYLYALIIPIIHWHIFRQTSLIRCFQLSGTIPGLVAKAIYGKKMVFNLGYDYVSFAKIEGKLIQSLLFSLLQPLAIKIADKVIVKNKTLISFKIYGQVSKLFYIPNGVDTQKFKPSRRRISQPSVLFVGRLEPQKNILTLIKAVSGIKKKLKLVIVGNGSLQKIVEGMATSEKVSITMHNNIPHKQIPRIYQKATIFVLPSIKEGSPKTLLEAMSSGLACIVSNIPEHKEIISNNHSGIVINPTVENIATAIQKLLASPSLRVKLGANARQAIVSKFNQKQLINQEIKLLQSL